MGQAKLRGTPEQRRDEARVKLRAAFPATVTCNNCQAALSEIEALDVKGMDGMRLAGVAHCDACSHATWVLDGSQEGLAKFRQFLDSENGGPVASGTARV